jgi:hypothetical protein
MAKALTVQQKAYALITHFEKEYVRKYDRKPDLNRHRDKWGFQDMLEDLGYDEAKEIVTYYFTLGVIGHPLQTLLRNYDRYHRVREDRKDDLERRRALREETRKRVEAFNSSGNN